MAFCSNCGHKLADGAKFCGGCGVRVGSVASESKREPESERKSFYEGEVHKCPQCGEVLNSFTGNCPSCGYELRGTAVVSSVQKFTEQLAELEGKREEQSWKSFIQQKLNGKKLSPVDEAKISLIQSFPIPTTKEDILEFITLAAANSEIQTPKELGAAWEMKLEQACNKAAILFVNDDDFLKLLEHISHRRIRQKKKLFDW